MQLPPKGTRGNELPGFARPLIRMASGMGTLMFRLGVKIQGRPLLRLTTTGARTGRPRSAVLGWFPDSSGSDALLVVASNGGSVRHPGWAYNLAADPGAATIDTGDGVVAVRAELLDGPERDVAWEEIVQLAPGYGKYTEQTDREIPIFRLTPLG